MNGIPKAAKNKIRPNRKSEAFQTNMNNKLKDIMKELEPVMHPSTIELAKRVINEAVFIGIIKPEVNQEYFKLASFSKANLTMVREILRKEKAKLTSEFDTYRRSGTLQNLRLNDAERYCKLYRAKYLVDPFQRQKTESTK